ncbi:MAG: ribonuclease P protein component [Phycisphaerales bacterium]|nr:ribonuclease P protein component [Phycisphaerales bacterium]
MPETVRHHRLPRSARICSGTTFRNIFARKYRISDRFLTIYTAPNDDGINRLGLAISRHFGNAVHRNRMKRLIREAFRQLQHELPGSSDWVIIPKPGQQPALSDIKYSIRILAHRITRKNNPNPRSPDIHT